MKYVAIVMAFEAEVQQCIQQKTFRSFFDEGTDNGNCTTIHHWWANNRQTTLEEFVCQQQYLLDLQVGIR